MATKCRKRCIENHRPIFLVVTNETTRTIQQLLKSRMITCDNVREVSEEVSQVRRSLIDKYAEAIGRNEVDLIEFFNETTTSRKAVKAQLSHYRGWSSIKVEKIRG